MELLAVIGSCTIFGLPLLRGIRQHKRQAASGANRFDEMTEGQFEAYLEALMWKLGYQVERPLYTDLVRAVSDGKSEKVSPAFIISTNGLKIAVCTQHDGKPLDSQTIQAAITAQKRSGCSSAMIVCSCDVSEETLSLVRREKVILWTKNDVMKAALSSRCQSSQNTVREYSERRHLEDCSSQPQQIPA